MSGGFRVIESGEALPGGGIVRAAFDRESALSGSRGALLKGEDHPGHFRQQRGQAGPAVGIGEKTGQSSEGQDNGVEVAFVGFGEVDSGKARVDVAANRNEFRGGLRFRPWQGGWQEVGEVGNATGGACSDSEGEPLGETVFGCRSEDDHVAWIGTGRGCGEHESRGAIEREVLVGVDGEVDFAREQSGIEFRDKEFASRCGGEGDVEELIALGFDANEFDAKTWVEAFDLTGDPRALSEGEEGASGAES